MLAMWAVRALGWLRSAWGIVADYPWQATCVGLILACAWLWHGERTVKQDLTVARAAIVKQNAAIAQWQKAGEAMQAKGAAALATVQQANRPLIERAVRLEHYAPDPMMQADCRTPQDVMDAKEQL